MGVLTLFRLFGSFDGKLGDLPSSPDSPWAGLIEIGRKQLEGGGYSLVFRLSPPDGVGAPSTEWTELVLDATANGIFVFEHLNNERVDVVLPAQPRLTFKAKKGDKPQARTSKFVVTKALDIEFELVIPTAISPLSGLPQSAPPLILAITYDQASLRAGWVRPAKVALKYWTGGALAKDVGLTPDYLHGGASPVTNARVRGLVRGALRRSLVLPGIGRELAPSAFSSAQLDSTSEELSIRIVEQGVSEQLVHAFEASFAIERPKPTPPIPIDIKGGAISADNNGFRLTLPGTKNGELRTNARYLEVRTILAAAKGGNRWKMPIVVHTRLAWHQKDENAIRFVFNEAIGSMNAAVASLHATEPEQPQSLLAELPNAAGLNLSDAALGVYGTHLAGRTASSEWVVANAESPLEGFRLSVADEPLSKSKPKDVTRIEIEGTKLPSFLIEGDPAFTFTLAHDPQVSGSSADPYLFNFRLVPVDEANARQFSGRLGGLRFGRVIDTKQRQPLDRSLLHADEPDSPFYSHLRFGRNVGLAPQPASSKDWVSTDVDIALRLEFENTSPVALDVDRHDRSGRAAPILIALGDGAAGKKAFLLTARETIGPRRDRRLVATLSDVDLAPVDAAPGNRGEYVLIGTEPFSVLKVYSEPLFERGDQQTVEVAAYDSDTRRWQLKTASRTYQYSLPPQSVGESADKPRRHEIVDSVSGASDEGWPFPRDDTDDDAKLRYRPVEFRLTPSADLWITPSDLERGYFDPEWGAREIFRQQGDFGIGAALAGFRGEFLYGLMVGVDPGRETGPAGRARVAEIEALTGRPPGEPRASRVDADYGNRWKSLSKVIARRPERLEFWNQGTKEQKAIASSSFREGAAFALRRTALHRPAVVALERSPVETPEQWKGLTDSPRLHPKGLTGGALWPIESRNVYESLLREPASTGGRIERIALSPLGGDADQRAEFRNGLIAIVSETRNGFIQRQQVEVIGRIAVLWHRAKHVVVYERTASPSAQFTPEDGSYHRTRRPVLRKVSEYIELLEPYRPYPDFDDVSPRTTGFLEAVQFDKIIPVDSVWSSDVGNYGWKIPLWNAYAAAIRPQVYPRPQAGFVTTAEGEGTRATVSQDCTNPDNIFFYTDTLTREPDTNAWPAVLGIDFSNMPKAAHMGRKLQDVAGPGLDAKSQQPAPRIPKGYRRFTWNLAPAAHRTVMNAARAEKPIYAGLETLTFARATEWAETIPGELGTYFAKDSAVGTFDSSNAPNWSYWKKGGAPAAGLATSLDAVWTDFDTFLKVTKLDPPDLNAVLLAAQQLKATLANKSKQATVLEAVVSAAKIDDTLKLKSVDHLVDSGKARCEELVGDVVGGIKRKKLLILEEVRSWHAEFDEILRKATTSYSKSALSGMLKSLVSEALQPLFDGASQEVSSVAASVDGARGVVRNLQTLFEVRAAAAITDVQSFNASFDRSKPWSPARYDEFSLKLADCSKRFGDNLQAELDDARARLIVETDDLAQQLSDFLARWLKSVRQTKEDAGGKLASLTALLQSRVGEAASAVDRVTTQADDGYLDLLIKKIVTLIDSKKVNNPDHLKRLDDLKATLGYLRSGVRSGQIKLAKLTVAIAKNQQDAENLLTAADVAVTAIATEITNQGVAAAALFNDIIAELGQLPEVQDAVAALGLVITSITAAIVDGIKQVRTFTDAADTLVKALIAEIEDYTKLMRGKIEQGFELISDIADEIEAGLAAAAANLSPSGLLANVILPKVIDPAIDAVLAPLPSNIDPGPGIEDLRSQLDMLAATVEQRLDGLALGTGEILDSVKAACAGLATTIQDAQQYLTDQATNLKDHLKVELAKQLNKLDQQLGGIVGDASKLIAAAEGFETDLRKMGNDLTRAHEMSEAYAERVVDAASNLTKGGILAAPSNVLKLAAAAASVPDLPGLDFARERLGYYYDALSDVIDTTPVEAWFGKVGDQFKAIGLNFPFDKMSDRLLPPQLSDYGVGRILDSFGALKLRDLWRYSGLPIGSGDAIKLTNDFDQKQMRAWVRIDINLKLPGRRSLFAVGPFKLDFVDSRLVGQVMLEAAKDGDTIKQTGTATLHTNIDAVVSGQSMVRLDKVAVNYSQDEGLKVDFDPKNIKLNEIFRFIQDTLGSIFPNEVGGLNLIKQNGIPVGIEHEFAMPPIDLMYGTSGVTNIQIRNRFSLVAWPEFVIADRFSLSKPELPFIFSIFILGGTGYIWVETQYRPFTKGGGELTVMVEAAAGASATLGFAFAGIVGSVSITLSAALTYRKLIGSTGGGLGISLVLVILGNVNIYNIVSVYIGLMLRLSYRDTGQIDAQGTLVVTIRISRFFKITARADVRYVMRNGKTEKKTETSINADAGDDLAKAQKLLAATK